MKEDIQFLKDLQKQMKYEDEHDYDSQAAPRFWSIMDYREVPTHENYTDGITYYFNDGDFTEFKSIEDLQEFLSDYYSDDEKYKDFQDENGDIDFEELWEFVKDNLNDDGYFDDVPFRKESFIVPDTMFLTKEEAKRHLELNHYHYTKKAHTYAMTAWRAPKVGKLLNILMSFDWDLIITEGSKESSE
jgi:hypothetical protein